MVFRSSFVIQLLLHVSWSTWNWRNSPKRGVCHYHNKKKNKINNACCSKYYFLKILCLFFNHATLPVIYCNPRASVSVMVRAMQILEIIIKHLAKSTGRNQNSSYFKIYTFKEYQEHLQIFFFFFHIHIFKWFHRNVKRISVERASSTRFVA